MLLLGVKKPRYAHMAKLYEAGGAFADADYNYNMLAEVYNKTVGGEHPDFSTALHESARLNHYHVFEHTPEIQIIYNSLGRTGLVKMFYENAKQIRLSTLGDKHPAYAQSLYSVATCYKDNQGDRRIDEAVRLLREALAIQVSQANPLPTAQTMLALAELGIQQGNVESAIKLYEGARLLLSTTAPCLKNLQEAEELCRQEQDATVDPQVSLDQARRARELQNSIADPYFELLFNLIFASSDDQLMRSVLDLHRKQFANEFRETRLNALEQLADAYERAGNRAAAKPLIEELATMQQGL